jgi:hypothetical protein
MTVALALSCSIGAHAGPGGGGRGGFDGGGNGGLAQGIRYEAQVPALQLSRNVSDEGRTVSKRNPNPRLSAASNYILKGIREGVTHFSLLYNIVSEGTLVVQFLHYGGYKFPMAAGFQPEPDARFTTLEGRFNALRDIELNDRLRVSYLPSNKLSENGESVAAQNFPAKNLVNVDLAAWFSGDDCSSIFKTEYSVGQCQLVSATWIGAHENLSLVGLEESGVYRFSSSTRYLLHDKDSEQTGDFAGALKRGIVKYYRLDDRDNPNRKMYTGWAAVQINSILGKTRNKDVIRALLDLRIKITGTPAGRPVSGEGTCEDIAKSMVVTKAGRNLGLDARTAPRYCEAKTNGVNESERGTWFNIDVNCNTSDVNGGYSWDIVTVDSLDTCNIVPNY